MVNNEEKIKAFFSDEKKVKDLANDREFIESVASGTATPQTYKNEFQKLGLNLTLQEAEQVAKDTQKVLSMPVEKLEKIEEDSLANISGGTDCKLVEKPCPLGVTSFVLGVSGIGAFIAGAVYKEKGNAKVADTLFAISIACEAGSLVLSTIKDKIQIRHYENVIQKMKSMLE